MGTYSVARLLPPVLALAAFALMLAGYVWTFQNQSRYSDMITADTEAALELIDDDKAIVNNSFTLALWISALKDRPAPHTWTWHPPAKWVETDQHVRCVLGWRPECNPGESIERLDVGWVLIEARFPYYNERAPGVYGATNVLEPWQNLSGVPWLTLVYSQGTTELYEINEARAWR